MNLDTDMQYAFTHAIEQHLEQRSIDATAGSEVGVDKRVYDPRSWGRKAELGMAARVRAASELLGSRGRTVVRD
jgi:fructose-bisphosphate aldolase class II